MKLSEIEARMNDRWIVHGQDSVGGPTTHHDYAQCNVDVSLLIRAVRQLEARHNAMMEVMTSKYAKISFARDHPIDADVHDLIADIRA